MREWRGFCREKSQTFKWVHISLHSCSVVKRTSKWFFFIRSSSLPWPLVIWFLGFDQSRRKMGPAWFPASRLCGQDSALRNVLVQPEAKPVWLPCLTCGQG